MMQRRTFLKGLFAVPVAAAVVATFPETVESVPASPSIPGFVDPGEIRVETNFDALPGVSTFWNETSHSWGHIAIATSDSVVGAFQQLATYDWPIRFDDGGKYEYGGQYE